MKLPVRYRATPDCRGGTLTARSATRTLSRTDVCTRGCLPKESKKMKRWITSAATLFAALMTSSLALAVGTRHWVLERAEDFKGGDLKGVAVDSSGKVKSGFDLGRIPVEGESVIWSALPRPDGSILLGTANEGHLLELRGGQVKKLADAHELAVTSLVEAWDHAVFAATLPHGKVYKWDKNKWSEFVKLPDAEHVWQLAFDAKRGALYAATGPQGKLFRITQQGRVDVQFDAPEDHLMSVAVMPDGTLAAGSSDKAILYRVTGPGRSQVLYDFGRNEVRAIAVSTHGDVYAIANDIKTSTSSIKPKPAETPATPSNTSSKVKGKGVLARIDRNGVPEVLLNEDDEHLVSLTLGRDEQPYVGTGVEGRIYTVTDSHRSVLIADTDERQVSVLQLVGNTPFVVASDPAVVHPIRGMGGIEAAWTSKVLDAGLRASFGRLDWQARGDLELLTRSGNTREPDDSWSKWSAPLKQPGRIASPPGRFFQVKARFAGKQTSELLRVDIFFITDNQRAVITRVDASNAGADKSSTDGIAASGGPITGKTNSDVNLEWQVDNPDRDALRYRIKYQLVGTDTWYDLLEPDEILTKSSYKWDTSTFPEGRYRVIVEASDELSNPPTRTTRHSLQSGMITIDATPPAIEGLSLVGRRLKLRAVDGVSPIQRLEIALVGSSAWLPVDPIDGVWDEPNETVDADVSTIIPVGRHLVALRLYDAAGNFVVRSIAAP